MANIISQGAEAVILKSDGKVIKRRVKKGYRIAELDDKLRSYRTRKEAKLLEKSVRLINVPKIIKIDENKKEIEIEFIKGKKLADCFDSLKNKSEICGQIGKSIALLHDYNIIHGDLTTSNMILKADKVFFVDFGLGFESNRDEDKAVDLHVLKEALEARHFMYSKQIWGLIVKAYLASSSNSRKVLERLEIVEKRGRYKQAY